MGHETTDWKVYRFSDNRYMEMNNKIAEITCDTISEDNYEPNVDEVELSFELDKRTALKLRWMFFKQHIRVAFSVLFGKGNI